MAIFFRIYEAHHGAIDRDAVRAAVTLPAKREARAAAP
jgi:hypothetical protein